MADSIRRQRVTAGLLVAAVTAGAALLALRWAFLVPLYQAPDEPEHLDYALCLMERGGLFHAEPPRPGERAGWFVHPWTFYLIQRTHLLDVAFHPEHRMPPDYGTTAFFDAVDREAPPCPATLARAPGLAAQYPFGYYVLLAAWLKLIGLVRAGPVGLAFGGRILSVLLTAASVLLSYATARELGLKRRLALALTAIIGFLPLTSFVGSYVQPDNLTFTLTSLCFWLTLRQRRLAGTASTAALGLALGLLLVTKVHYYLCVLPPVLAALAVGRPAQRTLGGRLRRAALLLTPSLLLGLVYAATIWGTPNSLSAEPPQVQDPSPLGRFAAAVWDYYASTTHQSFWGIFGWMDTPLVIGGFGTNGRVWFALQAGTWAVLALSLLRLVQVTSRLVRLWRRGKGRAALRLATANVPINSFFLFTVLMFVLYVSTGNSFGAQGRNWLPFLLPIFLTAVSYAPRALSLRRCRRLCEWAVVLALLAFAAAGSYYALWTLQNRYYAPVPAAASVSAAVVLR